MRIVPAVVRQNIRVDANLLGENLVSTILDELTIPNQEYAYAKHAKRYEWWLVPEDFLLAELDGDTLVLPRGYALRFKKLLRKHNRRVEWIEHRKWERGPEFSFQQPFQPRLHQPAAAWAMIKHQQGIYEAPTGSGKSLTGIYLIDLLRPKKSIVLVNKSDLLSQWTREIIKWLGSETVGVIGGGKWEDTKRITVATYQSIWSKIKKGTIDQEWFDQFDLVIGDEIHNSSASTIREIFSRFPARMRLGKSATPDRKTGLFEIIEAVVGPVFYQDGEDELRKAGVLVAPKVRVTKTEFKYNYWSDGEYKPGECPVPKCNRTDEHRHQNNYQGLKDAIVSDEYRNKVIIDRVVEEAATGKHHHLIVSDEIRHLDALESELSTRSLSLPVYVLTGQVKPKKRAELIQEIKDADECIVFATVAKEGMDIPAIDRMYLAWPSSLPGKIQQWIGRATRVATGKADAIIHDFLDYRVDVLKKQFRRRRYECYDKLGLEVVKL